jgi:hypothetical protein
MLLESDGSVMAQSGGNAGWFRLTPVNGSYVNGTWSWLASMHDTRLFYASDVLTDGQVFVAGGEDGTGAARAERYDPVANTWTQLPSPPIVGVGDSISETLPDGRVLVGSIASRETAIYNPVANSWEVGPTKVNGISSDEESWVKLPDRSILTVDFGGNGTSERYVPALNRWVNDARVPLNLFDSHGEIGAALLLPDRRVLFLGSTGHTALYTPSGTDQPGSWDAGPDIPNGQGTDDAPAAMMVNGKILCAVGPAGTFNGPTTFYEYDPAADAFAPVSGAPSVSGAPFGCRMLDLPDGGVLLNPGGSQLYEYVPDGPALAAGRPSVSGIRPSADGSFLLTGARLNGISEGAAYGDDAQMASNYPLVRLSDGSGRVAYARTFDWSSTDVATGGATVTTVFTLPPGTPAGTYLLSVIANGIGSQPVPFSVTPAEATFTPAYTVAPDGSLWELSASGFAAAWSQLCPAGVVLSVSPSTDARGVSEVFVLGANHSLWVHNNAGWALLAPAGTVSQVSASPGNVCFAVDGDYSLWQYAGGVWKELSPGGTVLSCSAGVDPSGKAEVFALAGDHSLWRDDQGVWQLLSAAGTVNSVTASGDAVFVLAYGTEFWIGTRSGWALLSPAGWIASASGAAGASGAPAAFVVAADHSLWEHTVAGWHLLSAAGTVEYVLDSEGADVFVVASGGTLWEYDGSAWVQLALW